MILVGTEIVIVVGTDVHMKEKSIFSFKGMYINEDATS